MTIESNYKLLRKLELFAGLGPAELKRMIFLSRHYQVQPGEYLFNEGELTHSVFGILTGEFSVFLPSDGKEILLDQPTSGSLVGEMSVISGEPRSASMRAETASEVIEIDSDLFLETLTGNPEVAKKMMQLLAGRLINANKMLEHTAQTNCC